MRRAALITVAGVLTAVIAVTGMALPNSDSEGLGALMSAQGLPKVPAADWSYLSSQNCPGALVWHMGMRVYGNSTTGARVATTPGELEKLSQEILGFQELVTEATDCKIAVDVHVHEAGTWKAGPWSTSHPADKDEWLERYDIVAYVYPARYEELPDYLALTGGRWQEYIVTVDDMSPVSLRMPSRVLLLHETLHTWTEWARAHVSVSLPPGDVHGRPKGWGTDVEWFLAYLRGEIPYAGRRTGLGVSTLLSAGAPVSRNP